jgi:hypothetical protein
MLWVALRKLIVHHFFLPSFGRVCKSRTFSKQILSVKRCQQLPVDNSVESETELERLVHEIAFPCCDNLQTKESLLG